MITIALINSLESKGTAIVLNCTHDKYKAGYLLLTANHVLQKISEENLNDTIEVVMFDDYKNRIPSTAISIREITRAHSSLSTKDVAALFITIEKPYVVTVNNIISHYNSQEETAAWVRGFPGIINNREEYISVTLKGVLPKELYVGSFPHIQIDSNYHHYENLKDQEIVAGLSGGPVLIDHQSKEALAGMMVKIPAIRDGENPYKHICFIKIHEILTGLHSTGDVLNTVAGNQVRLHWTSRKYSGKPKKAREYRVLLTGASGAGKSSFIKSLANHAQLIDSTGDGQTTRGTYYYNLSGQKPTAASYNIVANLLTSGDFVEERLQHVETHVIDWMFRHEFHIVLEESLPSYFEDPSIYFKKVNEMILSAKPVMGKAEKQATSENYPLKEINLTIKKIEEETQEASMKIEYIDLIYDYRKIFKLLIKLRSLLADDFFKDLCSESKELLCFLESSLHEKSATREAKKRKELFEIFTSQEGFFAIAEFCFLWEEEGSQEGSQERFQEGFQEETHRQIEKYFLSQHDEKLKGEQIRTQMYETIESATMIYCGIKEEDAEDKDSEDKVWDTEIKKWYTALYDVVTKKLDSREFLTFNFSDIWEDETLQYRSSLLFRVVDGNSLTSIIENVEIYDTFSQQYAYYFHQMGVDRLTVVDTCGLDHIEKGKSEKKALSKIMMKERKRVQEKTLIPKTPFDAILYIKKLDSGRPAELSTIFPLVKDVAPEIPIYCIFTGVDIFYHKVEQAVDFNQGNQNLPKNVEYLKSNEFKTVLKSKMEGSEALKDKLITVFTRNIIALCTAENEEVNHRFKPTNVHNMVTLFSSIVSNESSSIVYIRDLEAKEILKMPKTIEAIDHFIEQVFFYANSPWRQRHHTTVSANYSRHQKQLQLGFTRTEADLWDARFYDAYTRVALRNAKKIAANFTTGNDSKEGGQSFVSYQVKVETMIIELKDLFLGQVSSLFAYTVSGEKSEFRRILEQMYTGVDELGEPIYDNNPFDRRQPLVEKKSNQEKRRWLIDVTDFKKGLAGRSGEKTFLVRFRELFIDKLQHSFTLENERCCQNLLQAYPELWELTKRWGDQLLTAFDEDSSHLQDIASVMIGTFNTMEKP